MATKVAIVLAPITLSGCASVPGLYAEIGIGFKHPNTSVVARPECHDVIPFDKDGNLLTKPGQTRSCGGDNPTAHFNVGFEFRERRARSLALDRCEILAHMSQYFDGHEDREISIGESRCFWKFGGRRRN